MLLDQVLKTITRYNMFAAGDRVGVAVSGGADSVFLLHSLYALRPHWDLKLEVIHVDHKLRGEESRGDACFVRELAARLGLRCHVAERDVARLRLETGGNLEQTARQARRQYYMEFFEQGRLDHIATGHTRSDQAETVLFRFLRGSGTAGLAGIRPRSPFADGRHTLAAGPAQNRDRQEAAEPTLVRPLIEIERPEIERYLRDHGIAWREDSSNASLDFARNRIRRELLPQLVRDWNPELVSNLARTAGWAQDEEEYWSGEIARLAAERLTIRPPAVLLRVAGLAELPRAVARRLIRRAVEIAKGNLQDLSFQHVETILALLCQNAGDGRVRIPGLDVSRSFDWVRLAPPGDDSGSFQMTVRAPGRFALPDSSLELLESSGGSDCVYNINEMAVLDGERVRGELELRGWRPGDRYQPLGRAHTEKIKFLFQEARIPLWERQNWPILTIRDEIVWARKFGPALQYAATPASRSVLKVWEERA